MPGLDRLGRPVGYGDGRDPSLADKVRLLQQLVKERQAMGGKRPPVASINRPRRNRTGGLLAPVDPSRMPKGKPGPPLPDGRRV
jgi:hypothetical protein